MIRDGQIRKKELVHAAISAHQILALMLLRGFLALDRGYEVQAIPSSMTTGIGQWHRSVEISVMMIHGIRGRLVEWTENGLLTHGQIHLRIPTEMTTYMLTYNQIRPGGMIRGLK